MQEKLARIKDLIDKYDHEMVALYEQGDLEYWDGGNFDDCFESGRTVGYAQAIQTVVEILENK